MGSWPSVGTGWPQCPQTRDHYVLRKKLNTLLSRDCGSCEWKRGQANRLWMLSWAQFGHQRPRVPLSTMAASEWQGDVRRQTPLLLDFPQGTEGISEAQDSFVRENGVPASPLAGRNHTHLTFKGLSQCGLLGVPSGRTHTQGTGPRLWGSRVWHSQGGP